VGLPVTSWHDPNNRAPSSTWTTLDWIILIVLVAANLALLATGWHV